MSISQGKTKKLEIENAVTRINAFIINVQTLENYVSFLFREPIAVTEVTNDFIQQNATYFAEVEKLIGIVHGTGKVDLSQDEIDDIFNFPIKLDEMKQNNLLLY